MIYLDVSESSYSYSAIQFVSKWGLLTGDPEGKFYPDAPITWAEMCQILTFFLENGTNLAQYPGLSLGQWEGHWAAPYMAYCVSHGIIEESFALTLDLDSPIMLKEVHGLFAKAKGQRKHLEIPERSKWNRSGNAARADVARLIYRICDLTGRAIAESVFRLNKRNRWSQSLRLLFSYALCVEFVDSDIALIFRLIVGNPNRSEEEDALCYEHMAKILKRKNYFRIQKTQGQLFHYTSMGVLERLTVKQAKFRLSNVAYLNDPMEGHLFDRRMKRCFHEPPFLGWEFMKKERNEFFISNSFVVSFTDQETEQLPMWLQYADGGMGCRIGVEASSIKSPLYGIVYDENTVNRFLASVKIVLQSYLDRKGEVDMKTDIVFSYTEKVLTQVSYLHKDKHHEHEREIRILLFADPSAAKVEGKIREGEIFPRLYIELEDEVEISSITLGPRATGSEKIAIALAGRKFDPDILQKSEIQYR